ncbi:MAG: HU family DNA-binding protein [Clostridiales bacterium]|nr:HU family DNA-binding protein [Clostridiales bacterium]
MNKFELVSAVAEKVGISKKDSGIIIDEVVNVITDTLAKGEKVQLVGFGSFEVRERAAREGRNPQKPNEKIMIPASKVPVFKAGRGLKDAVK